MTPIPGTVYLVGAGPGHPDLITVRGLKLLQLADVVLYDRLVSRELIEEAKPGAEWIDVGKTPDRADNPQESINNTLIDRARAGKSVVRLKGGDPFVFGRGAEEVAACRDAAIDCIVIPGVTSALAAPAAIGIPVTHRGIARSFAVVTARTTDQDSPGLDFDALAHIDTLIIMMGREDLPEIARCLIQAGRHPDTPAACIQHATTHTQKDVLATLSTIANAADRAGLSAPVVTVVGQVAAIPLGDHSLQDITFAS